MMSKKIDALAPTLLFAMTTLCNIGCAGSDDADKESGGGEAVAGAGGASPGAAGSTPGVGEARTGTEHPASTCSVGEKRCSGSTPQSCDGSGQWENDAACPASAPVCSAGTCTSPLSCVGLAPTCGPDGDESCCASAVVPGGTYNRSNDPAYPATVSDFGLDRFEITVGRFREFVAAYPGSKPAPGAGKLPRIDGSGWDAAWDVHLPEDQATLTGAVKCNPASQTWTDAPGANENRPMNCITWYDAFAFCAWDGGRLPTEAEWNYAAAGGSEQLQHPWGSTSINSTYAVYDCTGDGSASQDCSFTDILNVGSTSPKGDGKWGQADLLGSMMEWNLDVFARFYPRPCSDCADVSQGGELRGIRGGNWGDGASYLLSSGRTGMFPTDRGNIVGIRCARTP